MINSTLKQNKSNYWIMFLLFLSCIWISIYPILSSMVTDFYNGYGNVFDTTSPIFSNSVLYIIISSLVTWAGIELLFVAYRFIISFKIYAFILPPHKLKNEMRTYFIYRNLIYGLFLNICFILPYLHSFIVLAEVVITTTSFIYFSMHIQKTYSEPLIGHFVFRCFINPIIIYEILAVAINFLEVM